MSRLVCKIENVLTLMSSIKAFVKYFMYTVSMCSVGNHPTGSPILDDNPLNNITTELVAATA